jgi:hypothetical protein
MKTIYSIYTNNKLDKHHFIIIILIHYILEIHYLLSEISHYHHKK